MVAVLKRVKKFGDLFESVLWEAGRSKAPRGYSRGSVTCRGAETQNMDNRLHGHWPENLSFSEPEPGLNASNFCPRLLIPHGKSFFGLSKGFWNPEKAFSMGFQQTGNEPAVLVTSRHD
jgi:hypothetical protein